MGKDLGTYHLRVTLNNDRQFIYRVETGSRHGSGGGGNSPVDAIFIRPTWDDEASMFSAMIYMFEEGNYSCDCNLTLFWCRAQQLDEPDELECGDTMGPKRLEVMRPYGDSVFGPLWEREAAKEVGE